MTKECEGRVQVRYVSGGDDYDERANGEWRRIEAYFVRVKIEVMNARNSREDRGVYR